MRACTPLFLLSLTFAGAQAAAAQTLNPGNGHHYEFVSATVSWSQARADAEAASFLGAQGHLATISDAAENAFVFSVAPNGGWLGGFQDTSSPSYSEPLGGWTWVTGEPFSYSQWANNEPNNAGVNQNYMELWDIGDWNDANDVSSSTTPGYIVEYDTGAPPVLNPANGHYYLYVDELVSAIEARDAAQNMEFMGRIGHLATVSDAAEDAFVRGLGFGSVWLDGVQDTNAFDYSEPDGGWRWMTGEPFSYTHWFVGEPNNGGGAFNSEEYLELYNGGSWNDTFPTAGNFSGYVVEFDTDYSPKLNPANGKYYLSVDADLCWDEAREAAAFLTFRGGPGHLVTINSASERDFVNNIMPLGANRWLGGYQDMNSPTYSEPAGGWRWVTDEPFTFTDWAVGEPSNAGATGEAFLELYGSSFFGTGWNDNAQCSTINIGYIVEFEPVLGNVFCMSDANSTGNVATMAATGSLFAADNDVTLVATQMPPQQFGIFVTSSLPGAAPVANGILCVGGNIGRFAGPTQIRQADATGRFSLTIDLNSVPAGGGLIAIQSGDTQYFQAWFRDGVGLGANFTNGFETTFQ